MIAVAISVVALIGLSACTSTSGKGSAQSPAAHTASPSGSTSAAPSSPSAVPVAAAVVTAFAEGGTKSANPAKPITVKVANGTLRAVTLANAAGKSVAGTIASNGTSWQSTEALGYGKTYSLTATARNNEGATSVKREKITTLTPDNMTLPYFQTVYGNALQSGATYGVGMIAVVHFDESIPNKTSAEQALTVTTTPHVAGAWYWTDNATAHWRPERYYAPGTTVTIAANVYGKDLGQGLYGQSDESASFRIGAKHYSIANAKTHQVSVYFDDKLVRTMPTSMGQGGYVQGKHGQIALWTMPGVYTVINHENPATMSSDSYGLSANSPYGYPAEKVYWSTKISTDGIYLHELDTTVWAQGHQNVSHGCLNLNYTNAKWFYTHAVVGDVVKVVRSGGPSLTINQGGDWSVPWATWVKGGAS